MRGCCFQDEEWCWKLFLLLQTYWAAVKAYVSIRSATVGLYKRKHMSASFCTISKNSLQLFNKLIFEMPNNT